MALTKPGDINKIVARHRGNRDAIVAELEDEVKKDPEVVLRLADKVQPFLSVECIRAAMLTVMAADHPERYLPYLQKVQNFFPDEELRERMRGVHHTHPWMFYTHGGALQPLFPNEYFKRQMDQGIDIFADPDLRKIFLLYNAPMAIASYGQSIRDRMWRMLDTETQADVYVEPAKEPGFACGGMEKNFLQAAREGHGLCTINGGQLLAKHYHAKGADKAKKVSYIAKGNQETVEGYMLWRDYIYAPTDGQHIPVIEALERGERDVRIEHLTVKPVRPLIDTTSRHIFDAFHAGRP